jgi:hypothetical protein
LLSQITGAKVAFFLITTNLSGLFFAAI